MTKLMQWLLILAIYGVFYVTALTETLPLNLTENGKLFVAVVSLIIYFFNFLYPFDICIRYLIL